MNLPVKQYTEQDVARARRTGKIIGWLQAGAVVIVGGIILNLLGWVPMVLAVGAVSWVGYKLLTRKSKKDDQEGEEGEEGEA